jgi:hypothetical protein
MPNESKYHGTAFIDSKRQARRACRFTLQCRA